MSSLLLKNKPTNKELIELAIGVGKKMFFPTITRSLFTLMFKDCTVLQAYFLNCVTLYYNYVRGETFASD